MRYSLERSTLTSLGFFLLLLCPGSGTAQAPAGGGTAAIKEVHSEGQKKLTEEQVAALTGLQAGVQVGKEDLQKAADKLVATGLFATVNYDFKTRNDGITLTFHVTESSRVPVSYDNFPWFGDSELDDAIRVELPFYNGTLPEGGAAVETAATALHAFLAAHKMALPVEHQVVANPLGDGNLQQFSVEGAGLKIASMSFSDATLSANPAVSQHLSEIIGKPYSRTTIDIFLAEQIKPNYLKKGYLKAKLGPAEVRLSGAPTEKLPEQIPVFVPITPGEIYKFEGADWTGNNVISSIALNAYFGVKSGSVADGMEIEAALDTIREEYGRRGYLDATVEPEATYDETKHAVSYKIPITEGPQYHMGGWVITGLSTNGEMRVKSMFPIATGAVFNKIEYEQYLTALQNHSKEIFGDLPIHYESVGHWIQPNKEKLTVDLLLDFK